MFKIPPCPGAASRKLRYLKVPGVVYMPNGSRLNNLNELEPECTLECRKLGRGIYGRHIYNPNPSAFTATGGLYPLLEARPCVSAQFQRWPGLLPHYLAGCESVFSQSGLKNSTPYVDNWHIRTGHYKPRPSSWGLSRRSFGYMTYATRIYYTPLMKIVP